LELVRGGTIHESALGSSRLGMARESVIGWKKANKDDEKTMDGVEDEAASYKRGLTKGRFLAIISTLSAL